MGFFLSAPFVCFFFVVWWAMGTTYVCMRSLLCDFSTCCRATASNAITPPERARECRNTFHDFRNIIERIRLAEAVARLPSLLSCAGVPPLYMCFSLAHPWQALSSPFILFSLLSAVGQQYVVRVKQTRENSLSSVFVLFPLLSAVGQYSGCQGCRHRQGDQPQGRRQGPHPPCAGQVCYVNTLLSSVIDLGLCVFVFCCSAIN